MRALDLCPHFTEKQTELQEKKFSFSEVPEPGHCGRTESNRGHVTPEMAFQPSLLSVGYPAIRHTGFLQMVTSWTQAPAHVLSFHFPTRSTLPVAQPSVLWPPSRPLCWPLPPSPICQPLSLSLCVLWYFSLPLRFPSVVFGAVTQVLMHDG